MMRDPYSLELRRQAAQINAAERRLAQMLISGKVGPVDTEKRRLRLVLGKNAKGEPVLSPWLRWQEAGVGALSIHSQPEEGEQMLMVSMSGTIGEGSIAIPASFDRDHQSPSDASDTSVFKRKAGPIRIEAEDIYLVGNVRTGGGTLTHEDVYIGEGHTHTNVEKGGDLSGPPPR